MLPPGSTARGHPCLVIRATGSPTLELSTATVFLEDRPGGAPPAARTVQRPPSSPIRPVPPVDKFLVPDFDSYTHRGNIALTTTLRAMSYASGAAQPALVGLRVAHATSGNNPLSNLFANAGMPFVRVGLALQAPSPSPFELPATDGLPAAASHTIQSLPIPSDSHTSIPSTQRSNAVVACFSHCEAGPPLAGSFIDRANAAGGGRFVATLADRSAAQGLDGESGGMPFADISTAAALRQPRPVPSAAEESSVVCAAGQVAGRVCLNHQEAADPSGLVHVRADLPQVFALGDERMGSKVRQRASRGRDPLAETVYDARGERGIVLTLKARSSPAAESACQCAVPPVPPSPHQPGREQAARRRNPARCGSVIHPAGSAASRMRRGRPETLRCDVKRCPAALECGSNLAITALH
ncbi:hypothetical protein AURDEDRAFT_177865 [Auricularia subglabra TFB-10046 SS5]|uniref:Uncharacterized protein n=1 Tax=Auricularia subglabra (strain TFB-10046 / SS5) TaxID=717982 RepID=J0D313_AURST|nr:hypothetical protein AURDEDRAFT_177865 [Auricularia subglabra TFB-10046 SS5]